MIIPSGYADVQVIFQPQAGLPFGAAFGFGVETSGFAGNATAMATTVAGNLTSSGMHSLWCDDVAPSFVKVKRGPNATGATGIAAYTEAGGQTGTVGYAGVCMLVLKSTGTGGRGGRGRMYIPGQSESAVDIGGFVQAATLTDAQSRVSTFLTTMDGDDLPMVLLHSEDGAFAADPPHLITDLTVATVVATQRRRQRR